MQGFDTAHLQLDATRNMSGGENRGEFHSAGTKHAPWELGVGGWELTQFNRYCCTKWIQV